EPSINVWGPLEGEYVAERAGEVMALAATDTREDAAAGGTNRWVTPTVDDKLPAAEPAPMAGQVPAAVPAGVYLRGGAHVGGGEPTPNELQDRPGLPLGNYRFHVDGTGYAVDSTPFTVTPAPLTVSATRSGGGGTLTITAAYHGPTGWRLMDDSAVSNHDLP